MLECVPNVSEGRDLAVLDRLSAACGQSLVDLHHDADHHRSVFTLAGPGPRASEGALRQLARSVAISIDMHDHDGIHPRLGALDVVPFIALGPTKAEQNRAVDAAHSFARWWSTAFSVPCFIYDDADEQHQTLPEIRRRAFRLSEPNYGPSEPHPTLGATAVGARKPLIAVNCVLLAQDVQPAYRIARAMRESDGGLPGVRALGFHLDAIDRSQVSMNLVDLDQTGIEAAVLHVRELAHSERTEVTSVEVVGLLPASELNRCSQDFLQWAKIDADQTIEARVQQRRLEFEAASQTPVAQERVGSTEPPA